MDTTVPKNNDFKPGEEITEGEVTVTDPSDIPNESNEAVIQAGKLILEEISTQKWEDLIDTRTMVASSLIGQNQVLSNIIEVHKATINNDPNIGATVRGLAKSLRDLTERLITITHLHADVENLGDKLNITYREGPLNGTDDALDFYGISNEYIQLLEQITHVASLGFLDVFTMLKLATPEDIDTIKKVHSDGVDEIKAAVREGIQNV